MKASLFFLFLFLWLFSAGQKGYYAPPLKIPLRLSASFAELRSNHFHSGIDFKTQAVTGIPVYAVADGFISRIVVSPGGYGNALYIDHYNGTTSVYGHLEEFRPDIQRYVRKEQYRRKSFRVDMAVSPELFLVEKGDSIAQSGNSGSSGGPHLHFEIRDTRSEEPLDPLQFGFNIADKTPPKMYALLVTTVENETHSGAQPAKVVYPLVFSEGKYHVPGNAPVPVYGKTGFAVEAYDYFDLSANRCGISTLETKVDGRRTFFVGLHRFSFNESRYINSYLDYAEWVKQRRRFQKTWIDPGNLLRNYDTNNGTGLLNPGVNGQVHQIEIEARDASGNAAVLEFTTQSRAAETVQPAPTTSLYFDYGQSHHFRREGLQLTIPKGALYTSLLFHYETTPAPAGYFSDLHHVHNNTVPLHHNAELKIKTNNLAKELETKALMVKTDPKTMKFEAVGGHFENDRVQANIRTLGTYAVRVDTIAPVIVPHSIRHKNTLTESHRIRFTISDDLSGIADIEGTIDGQWILFEYDAKNNLITHYFDRERYEPGKRHQFTLLVRDYKNNTASYEATFWK